VEDKGASLYREIADMGILEQLLVWIESKPIVLVRLPGEFLQSIADSKRGLDRFTFARPHQMFRDLKLPTLCLVAMGKDNRQQECFAGVASAKAAVTTFDSRLTLKKLTPLRLPSLDALQM
jgi:hypothetical protein